MTLGLVIALVVAVCSMLLAAYCSGQVTEARRQRDEAMSAWLEAVDLDQAPRQKGRRLHVINGGRA